MTGLDLIADLRRAAVKHRRPLREFVLALTARPHRFIDQLSRAQQPTPLTVERVRALAEAAAVERRPGETLDDAVRRLSHQLAA